MISHFLPKSDPLRGTFKPVDVSDATGILLCVSLILVFLGDFKSLAWVLSRSGHAGLQSGYSLPAGFPVYLPVRLKIFPRNSSLGQDNPGRPVWAPGGFERLW